MKRGAPMHPKLDNLMDQLGIGRATAVGTLELLWHFTARYAIQGDVGKWSDSRIASACGWEGNPKTLIDGLGKSGWLDLSENHRLLVHDWPDHADQSVRKTIANKGLVFLDGGVSFLSGMIPELDGKGSPTPGYGYGKGKAKERHRRGREERSVARANAIARIYRATLNNPGDTTCTASGRGPKNIAKLLADHDAKDLRQAAVNYAESCTILEKEPTYRMFCGNFYGRDATYLAFMPGEYQKPETADDANVTTAVTAMRAARGE